ncbi:MAG: hypothetical protein MJ010_04275 [Paludibacteraceae bacterium]|nr:hypothetical protein [Paludibacteraceae bacterium]
MKYTSNIIKNAFACGVRRYGRALLLVTALMAISSSAWATTYYVYLNNQQNSSCWSGNNYFSWSDGCEENSNVCSWTLSLKQYENYLYFSTAKSTSSIVSLNKVDGKVIVTDSESLLNNVHDGKTDASECGSIGIILNAKTAGSYTINYNTSTKAVSISTGSAPVGECNYYIKYPFDDEHGDWIWEQTPLTYDSATESYYIVRTYSGMKSFDVNTSPSDPGRNYGGISVDGRIAIGDQVIFRFKPANGDDCPIQNGTATIERITLEGNSKVYFHDEAGERKTLENPNRGLEGKRVYLKYKVNDVWTTKETEALDYGWYMADEIPMASDYVIYTYGDDGTEVEQHVTKNIEPRFSQNFGVSVGFYDIEATDLSRLKGDTYAPNSLKFWVKKDGGSWQECPLAGFSEEKLAYYGVANELEAGTYYFYVQWNDDKNCIVENTRGGAEISSADITSSRGNSITGGVFTLITKSNVTLYMDPSQCGPNSGYNGMFIDVDQITPFNTTPKVYVGAEPVRNNDKTVTGTAFISMQGCKAAGGLSDITEMYMYYAKDRRANSDDAYIRIPAEGQGSYSAGTHTFTIPDNDFLKGFTEEGHTIHVRFKVLNDNGIWSEFSDDVAIPYMYCENSIKAFNITPVTGKLIKGESMTFSTSILGGGVATYKWYVKQDDGGYEPTGATESTFTYNVLDDYSATKTYIKAVATGEFCEDDAEAIAEMGLCPTPTFMVDPVSATTPWATVTLTATPTNVAKVEWSVDNPKGILKDASINGVTFKGGEEGTYHINAVATGTECGSVTTETAVEIIVNPETPDDCK